MVRPNKYPWDKWLNGNTHVLHQGRDYHCSTESFLRRLRQKSNEGIEIEVVCIADTIAIQAVKDEKLETS